MEMIPQIREILSRAASDEDFRRKLESDPVETLRSAGLPLIQRYDIDGRALMEEEPAAPAAENPSDFKWTKHGWCFFMTAATAANLEVMQIDSLISDAFKRLSISERLVVVGLLPSLTTLILAGILEWRKEGKKCGMSVRTFYGFWLFWSAPGCGPHP